MSLGPNRVDIHVRLDHTQRMISRRESFRYVLPLLAAPSLCCADSPTDPLFRFGVIADPQYADVAARGTRFYRNSLQKLSTAITELNRESLEFVITLGDVIDRDIRSFDAIMPLYQQCNAPLKFALGNHDFDVADGDQARVLDKLSMKETYYSYAVRNWRFIILDGTEIATYRHSKGSPKDLASREMLDSIRGLPNAKSWNGGLSREQLQWFGDVLAKSREAGENVVVCNHYPVLPVNDSHNLWNADKVVQLIREHSDHVVAYFNGHNHKGRYLQDDGIHYLNFKGMVESAKTSAFAIVSCFANRLEVQGFEAEPTRSLSL